MITLAITLQFLAGAILPIFVAVWILCWLFAAASRAWLAFWAIILAVVLVLTLSSRPRQLEPDFYSPNPDLPTGFK